jgi:ArsR family transcriptional regulator
MKKCTNNHAVGLPEIPGENLPGEDIEALSAICKALGHPVRIRIVQHLKEVDRCVCGRIVEILPLAQSTVSQHLKILKEAGLVKGQVEGPHTCYCLDKEQLARLKLLINRL